MDSDPLPDYFNKKEDNNVRVITTGLIVWLY